jgi:pentatricopeptide repeat protein
MDVTSYNTLLKACMHSRDLQRAALALRWMAEDGVAPDEFTWNTLIKVGTAPCQACWAAQLPRNVLCSWHSRCADC